MRPRAFTSLLARLGIALALGAFVHGCREADAPAAAPAIESFVAEPSLIEVGGFTTLRWAVTGASTLTVRSASGETLAALSVPTSRATGELPVFPAIPTTYILEARSALGVATSEAAVDVGTANGAPLITSFELDALSLAAGESTVARWRTLAAQSVSIFANNELVFTTSDPVEAASGQLAVAPQQTTTYLLAATNDNGQSFASLTAGVAEGASIVSFVVSRSLVTRGSPTVLAWKTHHALDVQLVGPDDALVFDTTDAGTVARGSFFVTPETSGAYTLLVNGGTLSADVTVSLVEPPAIDFFVTSAAEIASGVSAQLSWETTGATEVVLREVDGDLLTTDNAITDGSLFVQPPLSTQYLLLARNAAGDEVSATVAIAVDPVRATLAISPTFSSTSTPTAPNILTWTTQNADRVSFTPSIRSFAVETRAPIDISATGTDLGINTTVPSATLALPFAFPFDERSVTSLTVSGRGYLAAEAYPALLAPDACTGTGAAVPTELIAAGWTRLAAGYDYSAGAKVFAQTFGSAPNRYVVVQWNNVKESSSTFTFEAVLYETGEVRFSANTYVYTNRHVGVFMRDGDHWVVGCSNPSVQQTLDARVITRPLAPNDSRPVFVQSAASVSYTMVATGPSGAASASAHVRYAGLSGLVISELMYDPVAPIDDTVGEWLEVHNTTTTALDLQGVALQGLTLAGTQDGSHVITDSVPIGPNETRVLGLSADAGANGGVAVDYVYPRTGGLALADAGDCVQLSYGGTVMDKVCYDEANGWTAAAGASLQGTATTSGGNDVASAWCTATASYGAGGQLGTPRAKNPRCVTGDECATAPLVDLTSGSAVVASDLTRALADQTPTGCSPTLIGRDRWVRLFVPTPAVVQLSLSSAGANPAWRPALALYGAECPATATATPLACAVGATTSTSLTSFLTAGEHRLLLDSPSGGSTYALTITSTPTTVPSVAQSSSAFVDVRAFGNALALSQDDQVASDVAVGFSFPFFGATYDTCSISTNGLVTFGALSDAQALNTALPSEQVSAALIAPFWDDLVPSTSSSVVVAAVSDANGDGFAIQWSAMDVYDGTSASGRAGAELSVQVVLYTTGIVETRYLIANDGGRPDRVRGSSATIGLAAGDGLRHVTYSRDTESIDSGTALVWTP